MNRSGPIPRKTPLKRSPMKSAVTATGFQAKPRKRINQVSAKRAAEADERAWVRQDALNRAGHRCLMESIAGVICGGPLDVDEIVPRGRRPGGHLDADNVQVLCRLDHGWKHTEPNHATALGLYGAELRDRRLQPPDQSERLVLEALRSLAAHRSRCVLGGWVLETHRGR